MHSQIMVKLLMSTNVKLCERISRIAKLVAGVCAMTKGEISFAVDSASPVEFVNPIG